MLASDADLANTPHQENIAELLIFGYLVFSILSSYYLIRSYRNKEKKSFKQKIAFGFNLVFWLGCFYLGLILFYDFFLR